jgi:ribosomal-protein-alanine N-acetyltransferase
MPADARELSAVHALALPPGWSAPELAAYCGETDRLVLKAENASGLHGFAVLQFAADEAEILTIAVQRESRRQGLASGLMKMAIALFHARSVGRAYLEVEEGNMPARSLYEKSGFRIFARRKNYYRTTGAGMATALIMRLDIGGGLSQVNT